MLKLSYKYKVWKFSSLLIILIGLILSIIGTERAFSRDIEWLKAVGPLFFGVCFTNITPYISIYVKEYRTDKREYKELKSKICGIMNILLIECKEEKVDYYGLSLTKAFEGLFEFFTSNLHKFKTFATEENYNEFEGLYIKLRKVDRMKYRILPENSPMLKQRVDLSYQVRTKKDIEKKMKEIIEEINRIYKTLTEKE